MTQPYDNVQQAPAGWYPDPTTGLQRYWDGQRWTDHVSGQPATATPTTLGTTIVPESSGEPIRTSTGWTWAIIFLPVVTLGLTGLLVVLLVPNAESARHRIFALDGMAFLLSLIVLAVDLLFASRDARVLRQRGLDTAAMWWILLGGWVYLLVRAIKAKRGDTQRWWALASAIAVNLVLGVVAAAVAIWLGISLVRGMEVTTDELQTKIGTTMEQQTGQDFNVDCPDPLPASVKGDFFYCTATAASNGVSFRVRVTWTDDFFAYTWHVLPQPIAP
jgi:hypothetical protein